MGQPGGFPRGLGAAAGVLVGVYYNAIFPTMGYRVGVVAFAAAVRPLGYRGPPGLRLSIALKWSKEVSRKAWPVSSVARSHTDRLR